MRLCVSIPYEVLEKIIKDERYKGLPPEEALRQFIIDIITHAEKEGKALIPLAPRKESEGVTGAVPESYVIEKLDNIHKWTSRTYEILEALLDKVSALEQEIKSISAGAPPRPSPKAVEHEERGKRRKSAIDFLKEQKIMFEADIANRIRNRDAFFERLRRDGAIVLELKYGRVAIDPDYWEEFKSALSELDTSDDAEIEKRLGKKGYALLKALSEDGVVYFDVTRRKWIFAEKLP